MSGICKCLLKFEVRGYKLCAYVCVWVGVTVILYVFAWVCMYVGVCGCLQMLEVYGYMCIIVCMRVCVCVCLHGCAHV